MTSSIQSLLITHAPPPDDNSPYHQMAREWGLRLEFQNFVDIQAVPTPEFRKQNIHPLDCTGIIFTNKSGIDHFFRICKDLRVEMPPETKYFCVGDTTAKYLQKYIIIRKRKLFVGERNPADLFDYFKKHSKEKYLYAAGDTNRSEITDYLESHKMNYRVGVVYETVYSDLSGLAPIERFDAIAFYSPAAIEALFAAFPDYKQGERLVAVFGAGTAKAAQDAELRIDIRAPQPETPSMTMAIEAYLSAHAKNRPPVND